MDFSQLSPQLIQQLMQTFGAQSPEELMQMAQQNPQVVQQLLGNVTAGSPNADWIDQSAQQQVEGQSIAPPRTPPSKPMTLFKQDRMPVSKDQSRMPMDDTYMQELMGEDVGSMKQYDNMKQYYADEEAE